MTCHRLYGMLPVLAMLAAIVGCASGAEELTVTVRDRQTHQPVIDAYVQLRPLHLFSSEPPYGILDPSPTAGSSGMTGADGTVRVEGVVDHPMDVRIVATGYVPLYFTAVIESTAAQQPWYDALLIGENEDVLRRLEVQLQP